MGPAAQAYYPESITDADNNHVMLHNVITESLLLNNQNSIGDLWAGF